MKLFVNTILLFFLSLTYCNADLTIAYSSKTNKPLPSQLIDIKTIKDIASYYIYKHKDSKIQWDGKKFINPDGKVGVMEKFTVLEDLKKYKNIEIKEFNSLKSLKKY